MDKEKAKFLAEALVSLIDGWNDAAQRDDRGRPNEALCLVLYDDGSGRLGTFQAICAGNHKEIIEFRSDKVMNVQHTFDNSEQLAAYFADWCESDKAEPTKAEQAVMTMLARINQDPRVAYLVGPFTQTYSDLTDAYAEMIGKDADEFRQSFEATLRTEHVGANADSVRVALQDIVDRATEVLGPELKNIVEVAQGSHGRKFDRKLSEREWRIIRFGLMRAMESI